MEIPKDGGSIPSGPISYMEIPEDVKKIIRNKSIDEIAINIEYKNWKNEIAIRKIIPLRFYFSSTEYHKKEQWLLYLWDL